MGRRDLRVAVILDAHMMSGLAIVRSMGRRGIPVIAVSGESPFLAKYSRYCSDVLLVPRMRDEPLAAVEAIKTKLDTMGMRAVVFGPTDAAVMSLNRYGERLAGHELAVPSGAAFAWVLD